MKKLIIIIFLLTASISYSQDTCKYLQGSMKGKQFIVTDTIYFLCDTLKKSYIREAGGMRGNDSLSNEPTELQQLLIEIQKIDSQILELQKQAIVGLQRLREQIIVYLKQKYNFEVK